MSRRAPGQKPRLPRQKIELSFYPRLLPVLACGFGAGVLCARGLLGRGAWPVALSVLLLGGIAALSKAKGPREKAARAEARMRPWVLPLLLLALGGGMLRALLAYPALPAPRESCVLTGMVAAQPKQTADGWEAPLSRASIDGAPLSGQVLLRITGTPGGAPLAYGTYLQAEAALSLPQGKRGDGGRDWRSYYLSKGISCTAAAQAGSILFLGQARPGLYGRLLTLRARTTAALIGMMGEENGTLAAGMLHGDTEQIPEEALFTFREAGIAHLLAVSGLHVGILVGALLLLLRRLRPWPQLGILAGVLALYCLFTALSPSTLRASLMAICMLAGRALQRRPDTPSSLSLAFLLLLLASPFSLFNIGLQLSFTAVLGILLLSPVLQRAFAPLPGALREGLAAGIAGQAGILPATAAYFGRMPLLAALANVAIIPLAGLVVLPTMLGVLLLPLLPEISRAFVGVADVTLTLIRALATLTERGGALALPAPTLAAGVLFFGVLLLFSPLCRGAVRQKRLLACACAAGMLLCWAFPALSRPQTHITVLDGAAGGGYVAHLHTPEEDRLVAGGQPRMATLDAYLTANGARFAQLELQPGGAALRLGTHTIQVGPGFVEADGIRYDTAQNGQLRFTLQNGTLRIRAYADDARYAILMVP